MFKQWWEVPTEDTMLRKVVENRKQLWSNLEDFISTAPAGGGLESWAQKNGVKPEEAERIAVLAQRFARFGKRVGELA